MGTHVLTPPLTLHAWSRATVRLALATLALAALGLAGLALALALPGSPSSPPAHFQGDIQAH
jgi:hypothetical protein